MKPTYSYRSTVLRVIDGDTIVLRVDLGFRLSVEVTVRLWGIDAPEVHGATREAGNKATARLLALCPVGSIVTLASKQLDKYGRSVGSVTTADGTDVGRALVAEGLAAVRWAEDDPDRKGV